MSKWMIRTTKTKGTQWMRNWMTRTTESEGQDEWVNEWLEQ